MCLYPQKNDDASKPRVMAATGRITPQGAFVHVPVEDFLDEVRTGTTAELAWPEAFALASRRGCTIERMSVGEIVKIFYDTDLRERAIVVYKYKVIFPSHERLEMDYPLGVF